MEYFRPPGPLSFEGNMASEWTKFKKFFDIFMKATSKGTEYNAETKIAMLLNLMGEKGMEIFDTFKLTEAERKDYDKVVKSFDDYCNPKSYLIYDRFKFHTRFQENGESFEHFLTEITKQVKKCEFTNNDEPLEDQMVRDRIVLGINNSDVQEKLLRSENLTLKKAIEFCRISEATHKQARELQQSHSVHEVKGRQAKYNSNKKLHSKSDKAGRNKWSSHQQHLSKVVKNCSKCTFTHKLNQCPAYGKNCRRCGKRNHFSNACTNNQINTVENVPDLDFSDEIPNLDNLVINTVTVNSLNKSGHSWYTVLDVAKEKIKFKIDSGSDVNTLPLNVFKQVSKSVAKEIIVKPVQQNLEAYGGFNLDVLGAADLKLKSKNVVSLEKLIIVNLKSIPILGLQTSVKLNLIKRIDSINSNMKTYNNKREFIENHKEVFTGLGSFPETCSIRLIPGATPVIKPPRRIALSLRDKVKNKLNQMESIGIIKTVVEPTEWVHNLVVVEKPDKSVRICLDPRDLNEKIVREPFEIPRLEDLLAKLQGMKFYSVIDLKDGFWQVPLDEASSNLCAFSTPFGVYKFMRLPFGLNFAPELFQRLNAKYFGDLGGIFIYFDDILIFGRTREDHDINLQKVIKRAKELNVKFNPNKFQYCQNEVKYLGYVFSGDGIKIDPARVAAIQALKEPADKKELQKFLGLINYLRNFIPNLSEMTTSLRELLKKNIRYEWQLGHSKLFESFKTNNF